MGGFHVSRVRAVLWKELLDLRKNRGLLLSLLVLPAMLVVVPIGTVFAYASNPDDPNLRTMALFYDPNLPLQASAAGFLIEKILVDWFGMFLVMPIFVPILISSQAVAGEKERRTIEPLLASPITAVELVAGKSLASLVPAVAISWLAFAAFCAGVDAVSWHFLKVVVMPTPMWLFGVGVIAPLFAFFGNGIAVVISARVAEARLAQQIAGVCVLPVVGLVALQIAGVLRAGAQFYALQGAVVLVLDVLLLVAAVRLFDRERLISRWM
ncbi:MAG TPA: ABC transporter permease subunit [Myxococcaceae bacterium]|jgi:ABC-type Na+ efflux pump permease subunit